MFNINSIVRTVKASAPTALTTFGVIGIGVFGYFVKKGTERHIKAKTVKNEIMEQIEDARENPENIEGGYTEEDYNNDVKTNTISYVAETIKAYIPAAIVGLVTISSFVGAHYILNKRYYAVSTALAGVAGAYNTYRENVRERFGDGIDKEMRFNVKKLNSDSNDTDLNGKKKKTSDEKTFDAEKVKHDPYTRCFAKGSPGWTDDAEDRLFYLSKMEKFANDKLNLEGVLTLNEVYEMLGYPRTPQGQLVGWSKKLCKNGKVSFGMYDISDETKRLFINGYEPAIWLDFNVQGNILQYI